MLRPTTILSSFAAVLLAASFAIAEVKVGDKAPAFKDAIGVDDKTYSLDDFKDAKAVVVCFTCNSCPVAIAYEDRFTKFAQAYKGKDVRFVAINVNNRTSDKLEAMKQRAEQKGFTFPYLYDQTQKSARDFGARVTPHLYVLDADRNVAYIGAFDDSMNAGKVTKEFVKDAVDAVLAGETPKVQNTRAKGCGIKYER